MSGAIPWKLLQEQFEKEGVYGKELNKLVFSPELVSTLKCGFIDTR